MNLHDLSSLDPGHTCVRLPNLPGSPKVGTNATLQLIYRADWDAPHNQTFYACADITFVASANDTDQPRRCLQVTEPGEDDKKAAATSDTSTGSGGSGGGPGSSGGSGGAIAGIVMGSLAGVSSVAAALLLVYRRRQQKKRQVRLARMEENARRDQFPMHKYASSQHSS